MSKEKTILIVEDEESMAMAIIEKLTKDGYNVIAAKNGEEGLNSAIKEHPDLILLDIVMPKMDGITMLKELRKDEWGRGAKVIMLTNLNDEKMISDALDQDSQDYLVKTDWKLADITDLIDKRLNS